MNQFKTIDRIQVALEDPFIGRPEREHLLYLIASILKDRSTGDLQRIRRPRTPEEIEKRRLIRRAQARALGKQTRLRKKQRRLLAA